VRQSAVVLLLMCVTVHPAFADGGPIAASAGVVDELSATATAPPSTLLGLAQEPGWEVRFESFADGTILVSERSRSGSSEVNQLQTKAAQQGYALCTAELFEALTRQPAPAILQKACDQHVASPQLKSLSIDQLFRERPLLCNGQSDDQQFREIECERMLGGYFLAGGDQSFWCANTLRSDSDRSMYGALNDEGEIAASSVVSCGGNSRFRFYKRDSVDDPWSLYRDYVLSAGEYISLWAQDADAFGDVDFRFRVTSSGGRHRSTGIFIDN
jgi:hypothetical protein